MDSFLILDDRTAPASDFLQSAFPNLVACLTVRRVRNQSDPPPLGLQVHKAISSRTLFGVISETPMLRFEAHHSGCSQDRRYGIDDQHQRVRRPYCYIDIDIPLVRPIDRIESLHFDNEAYLIPESNPRSKWVTAVHLAGCQIQPIIGVDSTSRNLDTAFEILRLAGRQVSLATLRANEADQIRSRDQGVSCELRQYPQYHVEFEMTITGVGLFIEKVSMGCDHLRWRMLINHHYIHNSQVGRARGLKPGPLAEPHLHQYSAWFNSRSRR